MVLKNQKNKIFIGVALPYVNGDIHVGHLAGYLIPADIFARYARLKGYEVLMVSGADCHGTPITVTADERGISPEEIVNEYFPKLIDLTKFYNLSFDIFTSTRTSIHKKLSQEIFINLLKNGYIFKEKSYQYFSEKEKKFLPDRYVEGECSFCHSEKQRGDQCESCGRVLNPGELLNPISKLTKSPVILKETEHYFLDYSKLQPEIENFVRNSSHWRPWVYSETISFLKEGLKPRAITRDLDWGIELPYEMIPQDMLIENIENKRFYVWFEAVIGYLSASVEWAEKNNSSWEDFWLNENARHYYFTGKDNLIFHTIFWPGQLIGQRKKYNLPYFPSIQNWLLLEGKKFSKSRGVHLDSMEIGKKYGIDNVRFYIFSIIPENKDSNFIWKEFIETINNELVSNIGNLIHRILVFAKRKKEEIKNFPYDPSKEIQDQISAVFDKVSQDLEYCHFTETFKDILEYVKFGNQYLEKNKPWQNDKNSISSLVDALNIVYSLRTLLWPIIPKKMDELSQMLGLEKIASLVGENRFQFQKIQIDKINFNNIYPLFERINL